MTNTSSLWLRSPRYDAFWLGFSAWIPTALFLGLYHVFGSGAVYNLFLVYLLVFGVPHVFMTWTLVASPSGRGQFQPKAMLPPLIWAAFFALLYLPCRGTPYLSLYQSFTAYFGFYHVLKQHFGFNKIYWGRYAEAAGASAAEKVMEPINDLLVYGSIGMYLSRLNGDIIHIQMGKEAFDQWYPAGIHLVGYVIAAYACYLLARVGLSLWQARRDGQPMPWPGLILTANVLANFAISFFAIPAPDLLLAIAVFTSYHNLQYWGFVLHYYQSRCRYDATLASDPEFEKVDRLSKLIASGQWKTYMGWAYGYTVIFAVVASVLPMVPSNLFAYFHQILHYTLDGRIWKRRYNPQLGKALKPVALEAPRRAPALKV